MKETKIILSDKEIPAKWYNIMADMPNLPKPPLHPATKQPVGPQDLTPIFPMALIEQEMSQQRWIDIPEEVMEIYTLWRPSPLFRAHRLESALKTPAKIYYKYEGVSPAGSHKPNTSIPQAYYNKKAGLRRIATETGAGQWGAAMALACRLFGLDVTVYMVKVSYDQKPYRRIAMETWGATVHPSPSNLTNAGRTILEADPENLGSLGIAISEAVEDAATHDDTNYSLGSVLNHVCLHQTVVGLEAKKQFEIAGDYPDIIIGCCGGGSNLAGVSFPFLHDKINGKEVRVLAAQQRRAQGDAELAAAVVAHDADCARVPAPLEFLPLRDPGERRLLRRARHRGGGMQASGQLENRGLASQRSDQRRLEVLDSLEPQ